MPNQMIHTNYGLRWMGRALANNETVAIAEVAVGIGPLAVDREVTGLVDERYRMPPGQVFYEPDKNLQVTIDVILPISITQVLPREVALFDSTGSCVACGEVTRATKFPDDRMRIRMYLAVPSIGFVEEAGEPAADPTKIEFPLGTLNEPELLPGTWAIMHDRDPAVFDLVKITEVTDTVVTLAEPPVNNWNRGSKITPVRRARFDSLPQFNNRTDRAATTNVRFEILELSTYAPPEDWGFCAPVFTFKPDWSDGVTTTHERNVTTFESEMGVREYVDPGERDRVGTKVMLRLFGRDNVLALRKFISAARGKAVKFWAPSFTDDLEPLGNISGSYFDVVDIGFSAAFIKPQQSRIMLAFVFDDGRPTLYRRLTSVVRTLTGERFFVDVPLPLIKREDLARINFMLPSRFDQDGFELRHHVDGSAAVSASVVLMSVDAGDLPDINCFVTSKPYPVVNEEVMQASMGVTGMSMIELDPPKEEITAGITVSSITLRDPLVTYSAEPEGLSTGMSMSTMTLVNGLVTYTDEAHGLETTMTVTGVTLT